MTVDEAIDVLRDSQVTTGEETAAVDVLAKEIERLRQEAKELAKKADKYSKRYWALVGAVDNAIRNG